MGVRVRLRIALLPTVRGKEVAPLEVVAVINSGYEAEKEELILPLRLAESLGLWPQLPLGSQPEMYVSASGPFQVYRIPRCLSVEVVVADKKRSAIDCDAIISTTEDEVLMNDVLAERFGLVVLAAYSGAWAFADDIGTVRKSEPRQLW